MFNWILKFSQFWDIKLEIHFQNIHRRTCDLIFVCIVEQFHVEIFSACQGRYKLFKPFSWVCLLLQTILVISWLTQVHSGISKWKTGKFQNTSFLWIFQILGFDNEDQKLSVCFFIDLGCCEGKTTSNFNHWNNNFSFFWK